MTSTVARMQADMLRLHQYFPYRIVWGAVSPDGTQQVTGANTTRRQRNEYARKGWTVYGLS